MEQLPLLSRVQIADDVRKVPREVAVDLRVVEQRWRRLLGQIRIGRPRPVRATSAAVTEFERPPRSWPTWTPSSLTPTPPPVAPSRGDRAVGPRRATPPPRVARSDTSRRSRRARSRDRTRR